MIAIEITEHSNIGHIRGPPFKNRSNIALPSFIGRRVQVSGTRRMKNGYQKLAFMPA